MRGQRGVCWVSCRRGELGPVCTRAEVNGPAETVLLWLGLQSHSDECIEHIPHDESDISCPKAWRMNGLFNYVQYTGTARVAFLLLRGKGRMHMRRRR